jgi:hypothetical protein
MLRRAKMAESRSKRHVVICGPGRAGTSFIMSMLTGLGFDTGFSSTREMWFNRSRCGMEFIGDRILDDSMPYYVKRAFYATSGALKDSIDVIDRIVLPVRSVGAIASSRKAVEESGVKEGGYHWADNEGRQAVVAERDIGRTAWIGITNGVPVIVAAYPRLLLDRRYLHTFLKDVTATEIDRGVFNVVYDKVFDKDILNNSYGKGEI